MPVAKLQNFSRAEKQTRQQINVFLKQALGNNYKPKLITLEYPPTADLGDYSLPCFLLAKQIKTAPNKLAAELAGQFKPTSLLAKIKATGPYLNFFVDQNNYAQLILKEIFKNKENFGSAKVGKGKKVMVEYFSPNPNKPLTIGHLRNISLGFSMAAIMEFIGYKVITATAYNDRGIAIAKTILAYQKWGDKKTPKQENIKPDHFVGQYYVKFVQEAKTDQALEEEAAKVLRQWEAGKKEVKSIWQKLMEWVLSGYQETLNELNIPNFDEKYFESEYYQLGKAIVEDAYKKGIFKKHPEGYIYADLKKYNLPDKILLRSDGTSLYITQDIYLAQLKDKHQLDVSIVVSGSEQDLQFQQLFKILKQLDNKSKTEHFHLSHGMIRLPSGKIKSREGLLDGTDADGLISKLKSLAKDEIKKRQTEISAEEIDKRAGEIALAALKYYILAVDSKSVMVFDPKKSIAFAGKTGPYLQYVYARINSIFKKAGVKVKGRADVSLLTSPAEQALIKFLARFPEVVVQAGTDYNPALVANYLFDLSKAFSLFYEESPVTQAEGKLREARLFLIFCVSRVLANGLDLLGIQTLEQM